MKDRPTINETTTCSERMKRHAIAGCVQPNARQAAAAALFCLLGACGSDAADTPSRNPTVVPSSFAGAAAPVATPPVATNTPPVATAPTAGPNTGAPRVPAAVPMAGSASPAPVAPTATGTMPCNVSQTLKANCQTCHAATPIGGAPMPLVTYADLQQPAKTQPAMKVYQLVKVRIHDQMRPMPPAAALPAAELATLDTWLDGGALSAPATEANCMPAGPTQETVGGGNQDGMFGRLVAGPNEVCYEFKTHNSTTSVDATPYNVGGDGEHYEQFYFKVPWAKDSVATAYATIGDNKAVLHHWLLFVTSENEVDGFHKTVPLPTLAGTNPILLAGWAVGGANLVAPKDMGFELPDPGKQINAQWHFYNSTGKPQSDASSIQICTVPKAMRPHIGAISWLGTEDLGGNKWLLGPGMPAHQESTFTTTCTPGRRGLGANDSIHIIGFEPHMHRIGKRMKTDVIHVDGTTETIFDKPFSFGNEQHYYVDYELKPGEKLKSSCTFNNTNDFGVPFGESSDTEMCYQFTYSWPAHALANGAGSLLGVTDTCW